ncbi:SGNH/GDSL hydrolase family protein [Mangrovibacterium marinum]|uniref:DUF1574 domain-containing protein n=1 Tax=Mangrovibacterium marinum TaxID=1639118 RepID=A0A2T5BYJ1_9BACT|nr:SGNH/GDSL hydrolase family protein [Mangrovibacterium marinum]PTN07313.1 hypothetical protein C8N47_11926 [Mangrovibacterium marinum]
MKILYRILQIILLPLAIIGTINYAVDPDYTLRKDYIGPLSQALINQKAIAGPVNINSRLLKKEWISAMRNNPNVLVIGSSRTLSISKDCFPGSAFFNASVTNCSLPDMYAFIELFDRKGQLPDTILLGTDLWLFGDAFQEVRWLNNREATLELMKKTMNGQKVTLPSAWLLKKEWLKELFSVSYLIRSLRLREKAEQFTIEDSVSSPKMMILPDGSRYIPPAFVSRSQEETKKKARAYFYTSPDEQFRQLSAEATERFERLIDYLREKGCQVFLYIPPYHPTTYQLLAGTAKTSGIIDAERYVRAIAREKQVALIGASDPAALGLNGEQFYDGVHLRAKALDSLITTGFTKKQSVSSASSPAFSALQ